MDTLFDMDQPVTRALTIRQPWASLIVSGVKDIENRSRATAYRGRIAIHAGLGRDPMIPEAEGLPLPGGVIIGTVEIAGCVRDSGSPWAEDGCWHWILRDPVIFARPIPRRGKLTLLWKLDDETAGLVAEAA